MGTGAIEIKSGYGLTKEAELKMLRVIRRLKESHPLSVKSTFLGAHAVPTEYNGDAMAYTKYVVKEILPVVIDEGLAEYIDAFCEKGYFGLEETELILEAGVKGGLKPKVHVNQFNAFGGVGVSVKHGAISVDHLEEMSEEDYSILSQSQTLPVALPLCSLFLSIPYTPGRQIIDAGLPLVLATDYNPGSAPSGNMNQAVALACIKMKLNPNEAINAATINGAAALEWQDEFGSIAVGKKANLFITKPMDGYGYIPYSFGEMLVDLVIIEGALK
jgi:imidazolonepropionase